MRTLLRFTLVILLSTALQAPAPATAQQSPPPALPIEPLAFPDFDERTLSNGADLIVVPQFEQPFVSVSLVIKAGNSRDPAGAEGLASFVAELLNKGTNARCRELAPSNPYFLSVRPLTSLAYAVHTCADWYSSSRLA